MSDLCTHAGAGKSSMLDCLCMRSTGGQLSGTVRVNGRSISKARFRSISTYVPQVSGLASYFACSDAAVHDYPATQSPDLKPFIR